MPISRVPPLQSPSTQSIGPIIAAAIALAATSPALAQSEGTRRGASAPPAREGNIYDHKRHQPTERDVHGAQKTDKAQVEQEVKDLLQQSDRLDKEAEQKRPK